MTAQDARDYVREVEQVWADANAREREASTSELSLWFSTVAGNCVVCFWAPVPAVARLIEYAIFPIRA